MENSLNLQVINSKYALFNTINIDGKDHKLQDNMKINLSFNDIEQEIGSKVVSLVIKEKYSKQTHYFEVMKGDNYGILFSSHGKTRDLIFLEKEVKVQIGKDKKIEKCLTSRNEVKRLLLINLSYDIPVFINDKNMTYDLIDLAIDKSIQVSVVDLKKGFLPFQKITENSHQNFYDFYQNNFQKLEQFHSLFKKHLDSKDIYADEVIQKIMELQEMNTFYSSNLIYPKPY